MWNRSSRGETLNPSVPAWHGSVQLRDPSLLHALGFLSAAKPSESPLSDHLKTVSACQIRETKAAMTTASNQDGAPGAECACKKGDGVRIFALMKAGVQAHHWSRLLLLYVGLLATSAKGKPPSSVWQECRFPHYPIFHRPPCTIAHANYHQKEDLMLRAHQPWCRVTLPAPPKLRIEERWSSELLICWGLLPTETVTKRLSLSVFADARWCLQAFWIG